MVLARNKCVCVSRFPKKTPGDEKGNKWRLRAPSGNFPTLRLFDNGMGQEQFVGVGSVSRWPIPSEPFFRRV